MCTSMCSLSLNCCHVTCIELKEKSNWTDMYTEPIYTEHSVTDRCRRCNTNVRTASEQAKG